MKLVAGRTPIYAGIGIAGDLLSADRVVGQIHIARSLNADGFCIFALTARTAATIVPAVGQERGEDARDAALAMKRLSRLQSGRLMAAELAVNESPSPSGRGPG